MVNKENNARVGAEPQPEDSLLLKTKTGKVFTVTVSDTGVITAKEVTASPI